MGIETMTVGVQADGAVVWAYEVAVGFAFDSDAAASQLGLYDAIEAVFGRRVGEKRTVRTSGYTDVAVGMGVSYGVSAGIEVGFWRLPMNELPDLYYAIEIEAGTGFGGGVGLYFERRADNSWGEFLGFQFVVGPAAEVDIRLAAGRTFVFLDSAPDEASAVA